MSATRGGRRNSAIGLVALLSAAWVLPAQESRPRVHVIATGGTISNMGSDPRRTGAELVAGIPSLAGLANVTTEQFSNVASGAITTEMWRELSRRVRAVLADTAPPAGVIITHGTDTMEETIYFLDLTVGGCAPVIITGAMRQANAVGADGPANLLNAIRVAVHPGARGRGALLLMNDEIFSARDVTKSNTTRLDAFTAPGAGPIGVADPDGIYFRARAPAACPAPRFDLDRVGPLPRVDVVQAYIGADSVLIDALVAAGAKGIVLAGVGRGGSAPSQGRALRRAVEQGVVVAVSNRTGSGRAGERGDEERLASLPPGSGATIDAADFNPQKARVLLMLALAAGLPPAEIAALFDSIP
ncbi:MAG TPA: asparaginase [Gemmatimonadaceae bacterium]|nr:asparaginase [Gemmatimonadaceae bacterium]